MNINYTIIMNIFFIMCAIGIIAGSTYGLGKNETDKQGNLYKTSTTFFVIGVCLTTFFTITLILMGYKYTCSDADFEIPQN